MNSAKASSHKQKRRFAFCVEWRRHIGRAKKIHFQESRKRVHPARLEEMLDTK